MYERTWTWLAAFFMAACISNFAYAAEYYVGGNAPFSRIQDALNLAQPGDTIHLNPGLYKEDLRSVRNGRASAPITLTGPKSAVLNGNGAARVFEINHDYLVLDGFTINGEVDGGGSKSRYRDKLLYLHGKDTRNGVDGTIIRNMTITNAGGECIRLRYFARNNRIENNTITHCGWYDFVYNDGGKNGEAIYLGTSTKQINDGKNPTSDIDVSTGNVIINNIIITHGNECVEFKEGSTGNTARNNDCQAQLDSESAGMGSRGSGNSIIYNRICGNKGAGIRVGGHTYNGITYGKDNTLMGNILYGNDAGGIKFQVDNQADVCGNRLQSNALGTNVGDYGTRHDAAGSCQNTLENYAGTIGRNSTVCNDLGYALDGRQPDAPAPPPSADNDPPPTETPPDPEPPVADNDNNPPDASDTITLTTITGRAARLRDIFSSPFDTREDYNALNTIDDDLSGSSRWSSRGKGAYIIYELSSTQQLTALSIAWYRGDKRKASFSVSTSRDGNIWTTRIPTTQTSGITNDYEGYVFDDDAIYGRFVKITGYGNSENEWTSLKEVKLYGYDARFAYNEVQVPAGTESSSEDTAEDVADTSSPSTPTVSIVEASRHDTRNRDYNPENTLDQSLDDASRFSSNTYRAFITYDLGMMTDLKAIEIAWYKGDERQSRFHLEGSADGNSWTTVLNNALSSGQTDSMERYALFNANGLRFARIVGLGNSNDNWTSIKEIVFVEE